MIVVGGYYEERCTVPEVRKLRGSGMRAASSLTKLSPNVQLHSFVEPATHEAARVVAGGLGIEAHWHERTEPVRFNYFTPLSAPVIDGALSRSRDAVSADDDTILLFGSIELPLAATSLKARNLILDPQRPRDLTDLDLRGLSHDRLAIVANSSETRILGGASDVRVAARDLLAKYEADVVITKWGARGALVTEPRGQELVGPCPTPVVWPIGSGDVFAATFAWAWGEDRSSPSDAARLASNRVAAWTVDHQSDIRIESEIDHRFPDLPYEGEPRVYLAAPFFDIAQRWFVELARDSLAGLGADVFSPLHDVGLGGPEVAIPDLDGLEQSHAVFAWIDGDDAGTLFENGFATARGRPIVAYAGLDIGNRNMLAGTGAEVHKDLSTAMYRSIWAAMGMDLDAA